MTDFIMPRPDEMDPDECFCGCHLGGRPAKLAGHEEKDCPCTQCSCGLPIRNEEISSHNERCKHGGVPEPVKAAETV